MNDEGERLELLEGRWYPRPRAPISHLLLTTALTHAYFELRQGPSPQESWWILPEPEVFLDSSRVIPAMAGWRQSRVPDPPSGSRWRETPDWVLEIASSSTRELLRSDKRALYLRQQIPFLWDIDLESRRIEVWQFSAADQGYRLLSLVDSDRELVQLAPFENVPLRLRNLWR